MVVINSSLDKKAMLTHIKTLRFEYLKENSLLECYSSTFIPGNHISSNLEKLSQLVGINISQKIQKDFSKSEISESAIFFLALNSCPSFFEKLYWKAIYGPEERMAMLTSNIIKKAKGDFALNIFAKVSSVLGFQHLSFYHGRNESAERNMELTKNMMGIKGNKPLQGMAPTPPPPNECPLTTSFL